MKPAILVTAADLAPQALAMLGGFEIFFTSKAPDEDELVRLVAQHQPVGMIVRYGRIPARVMDASANLRVIAKHGVGIDTIDVEAAKARGIAVRPATGANADAVAEHAWALILAAAKDVVGLDARMHAGYWDKATHKSLELRGKTLGVVGLGSIGSRVAQLGVAFGMKVLAFDPFARTIPSEVTLVPLERLFAESHMVSLNCPLTDGTRHLVNRDSIAKMRDGVIIVNTGRGGLVDDAALLEALASRKVRAAGLDAFTPEPLVGDHQYRDATHAILTPHVGGVSEDAYVNMGVAAARNILEVLTIESVPQ
ncbi:MAG TPA: hydroxyacid dehydrogenase [Usitatibacter sp.]|nr:hydroxyacid dehydrogenase [Usitatibacter sp.]